MHNGKAESDMKTEAQCSRWRAAIGIFLLVLALYVLSSPGRIDIIDGQARFDVAYNWLQSGRPIITDPWIRPWISVPGRNHLPYSYYGAPASVFPMPLIAIGMLYDGQSVSTSEFLFSMTSPIFGALIAVVLFLFYIELGISMRAALLWTMISSFATLLWPSANSSFDNAQHAFFVITSVYLGFLSAKLNSKIFAAAGGLTAAVLVLYQDYFFLIVPFLAIAAIRWKPIPDNPSSVDGKTQSFLLRFRSDLGDGFRGRFNAARQALTAPGETRASWVRYLLWCSSAIAAGIILSLAYNHFRFGSYLENGKVRFSVLRGYPIFGNPLVGFATLLLSPGKSIVLYSPPILLGMLGIRTLRKREPKLGFIIAATSIVLISFLSFITFAGGDWCWGPRYLVVLLPLWALAFPFLSLRSVIRKRAAVVILVSAGLLVQVGAISVENQRFFFEHKLHDFFWAEDPSFYFNHSALFSRVAETLSLANGVPPTARMFNEVGVSEWCTYTLLGPDPRMSRNLAPLWMRHFSIFYLPKPWPLWMPTIESDMRPIRIGPWLSALFGIALIGTLLISPVLRTQDSASVVGLTIEEVGAV